MKTFCTLLILTSALAFAQSPAKDDPGIDSSPPQGITVDDIIRKTADKESEFAKARNNYIYRQDVRVDAMDGDTVTGTYKLVEDITYRDDGRRLETVVFAPASSLAAGGLDMSPEDFDDIRNRYPFVLTAEELPKYQVLYVGKQKVDE